MSHKLQKTDQNDDVSQGNSIKASEQQLNQLKSIQTNLEKINEEATEEVLKLEKKFNEVRKPEFQKRAAVIKTIPGFWLDVFLNHEEFRSLITEEDEEIFKHMYELDVADNADIQSGYRITMKFKENPFLSTLEVYKDFRFEPDGSLTVTPSQVTWKKKPTLSKGKKRGSPGSFFEWWFDPEDQESHLAELIKEDIWADPLIFFANPLADDFDYDENEENDEDEDEDEDEDSENEDNEVDSENEENGDDGGDDGGGDFWKQAD